jgi:hypothetical protein
MDLFDDGAPESDFALPGDEERLSAMRTDDDAPALQPAPDPPAAAPAPPADPTGDADAAATDVTVTDDVDAPAATGRDPRVESFLSKYDGDVDKALHAAAELQTVVGRQGQELGELRELAERFDRLEQTVTTATQPQYDPNDLDAFFAENPTRIPEIAQQAFYARNDALLEAAIDAWEEVDRAGARRFNREVAVARARQEVQAEQQQSSQAMQGWNDVARTFSEQHPDIEQHAPKMRELAEQYPHIVSVLQTGTPQARVEVLEFLYEKARGHASDTLQATSREIAREAANAAHDAIKEAAVASAATAVTAPATSVADRIAAEWETADAPYNDGWKI